ncbi:Hypothetical protein NTJ_02336 [Nesidiocoris tenuis]|uniref:Uncharacterized protein n=1 Tax=Nesidiocoris tenuis TaxID=355587 RepID=A0ABN7AB24_9HEMI|nr:Hypothetical protein NTJ_02336 [Nesidiocoris tenuis]
MTESGYAVRMGVGRRENFPPCSTGRFASIRENKGGRSEQRVGGRPKSQRFISGRTSLGDRDGRELRHGRRLLVAEVPDRAILPEKRERGSRRTAGRSEKGDLQRRNRPSDQKPSVSPFHFPDQGMHIVHMLTETQSHQNLAKD